MPKKTVLLFSVLLVFLPLLLLCWYNQPTVDDMWYTWMAKQHGFLEAQHQWFITINGRYSSNMLMSLNTWVYGSTIGFKIAPALVLLAWVGMVYALLRRLTGKRASAFYCFATSLLLTCCYYLCMPGLHEGTYWLSAVTGYQVPLLLYLCCWLLIQKGAIAPRWQQYFLLPLLLLWAGGFHELIALIACAVSAYIAFVRYCILKKPIGTWLITALVLIVPILIQVLSIGNRHKVQMERSRPHWSILEVLQYSIAQTGYHIAKDCLLSPAFWFVLLAAWFIAFNYLRNGGCMKLPFSKNVILVGLIVLPVTFLPGLVNVFIENNAAPLRIMNLSAFIFIVGCMLIAGLYGLQEAPYGFLPATLQKAKHSCTLLFFVPVCLGICSGNEWVVVKALTDGSARYYDQEAQQRFDQIKNCPADTCFISCLTHQPLILSLGDICKDGHLMSHLGKVYGKTLVVSFPAN